MALRRRSLQSTYLDRSPRPSTADGFPILSKCSLSTRSSSALGDFPMHQAAFAAAISLRHPEAEHPVRAASHKNLVITVDCVLTAIGTRHVDLLKVQDNRKHLRANPFQVPQRRAAALFAQVAASAALLVSMSMLSGMLLNVVDRPRRPLRAPHPTYSVCSVIYCGLTVACSYFTNPFSGCKSSGMELTFLHPAMFFQTTPRLGRRFWVRA
jgi:hypothetical protein